MTGEAAVVMPTWVSELVAEVRELRGQVERLVRRQAVKEHYTPSEFGEIVGLGKRTVRDYCNEGRLKGVKKGSGHGRSKEWAIPHAERLRYEREGLLPRRTGE